MNVNVGFKEVQAYAQTHNIDFKTAAQKLGLSQSEAEALEKLGGDPGAPVDGFSKKPDRTFILKSGNKVEVYTDKASGNESFKYYTADGTPLQEEVFMKEEGFEGKHFAINSKGNLVTVNNEKTFYANDVHDDNYYAEKRRGYNNEAASAKEDMKQAFSEGRFFDGVKSFGKGVYAAYQKLTTPENAKEASVQQAGIGKFIIPAAIATIVFASCTEEGSELTINNKNEVSASLAVTLTPAQMDEIIAKAIADAVAKAISGVTEDYTSAIESVKQQIENLTDNVEQQTEYMKQILAYLIENNGLLQEIKQSMEANGATTEAILDTLLNIKVSVEEMKELVKQYPEYSTELNAIINAINSGNESLAQVNSILVSLLTQLRNNGQTQADILEKLDEIQNSNKSEAEKLTAMLELLKNIDNKLNVVINQINEAFNNDKKVQAALEKLTQLVEEGNAKADITNEMLAKLLEMMENGVSKEDIKAIIEAISNNGDKIDDVNFFLNKIQNQNLEFQQKVLDMVAEYGDIVFKLLETAQGSDAKLDAIAQLLAKIQGQDEAFQKNVLNVLEDLGTSSTTVLNEILASIGDNGDKLNDITQLLAKIDSNIEKYGEEGKALGQDILNAIKTLGADISADMSAILEAINTGSESGKNIEALLDKVLEKLDTMDANQQASAKAIIEAIGNISVGSGGNVDLSSIEAMLKELIELTKQNNSAITDLGAKVDVLNVTAQAILDKIDAEANKGDERYQKVETLLNNILEGLKTAGGYDDTKLMNVLAKLSDMINTRLEELLNAIKDHEVHVTVDDIKVTCKCDCGGNHEGIIGNLEDILD